MPLRVSRPNHVETEPAKKKPVEEKPVEEKPVEEKPVETKPFNDSTGVDRARVVNDALGTLIYHSVEARKRSLMDLVIEVLAASQSKMLDPTKEAVGKYIELLDDMAKLVGMFRGNTSAGSDSNHIKVNVAAIKAELERLKAKWGDVNAYGPAKLELIKRLAAEWHLPYVQTSEHEGVIKIDISPIEAMLKATDANPDATGNVDWMFAIYQAWNTSMTEQRTQIENENTLLSELARNALATFNNIVNIISSMIQALTDCAKQSARAIGG